MGFRYQKRIQILPGVRINLSKSGIGYSLGPRGFQYTKHGDGRRSRSFDLPGGFSHRTYLKDNDDRNDDRNDRGQVKGNESSIVDDNALLSKTVKPGFMASDWEKDIFRNLDNPAGLAQVAREHHDEHGVRVLCASLEGLWHFERCDGGAGDPVRARELLGWAAVNGAGQLGAHSFVIKYLESRTWPVEVAGDVTMDLSLGQDVVLLAAAELHQVAGDVNVAVWLVEQAEPTSASALSLVELYSDNGRDQDVIDVTNELDVVDDATGFLITLRGRAFVRQGFFDAGRDTLKSVVS